MDVIHRVCVGMDISKTDAKVCVRVQGDNARASTQVRTWGATAGRILDLGEDLLSRGPTCVVMEATSDYWKPYYYILEALGLPVMLVNPRQARQIPGRKTDVNDAVWLSDLAAHGLLHGSFVPPLDIRELKDLVRLRTVYTRERSREVARLEKVLESAAIKLSSTVSDILGVSGRRMLDALVAGERDPQVLAQLGDPRLKATPEQLAEALTGRFNAHHGFLVRLHLETIDELTAKIDQLTARIDEVFHASSGTDSHPDGTGSHTDGRDCATAPDCADGPLSLLEARTLIASIDGFSNVAAEQIIGEIGIDMSRFPTPGHLASWGGVAPGANESAGKVKSTRCLPGDKYLKGILGVCARAVINANNSFFAARYRRVMARRGKKIALVAIMRSMLEAIWQVLTTRQPYRDPGVDYYTRLRPGHTINNAIDRLRQAGCTLINTPEGILIATQTA